MNARVSYFVWMSVVAVLLASVIVSTIADRPSDDHGRDVPETTAAAAADAAPARRKPKFRVERYQAPATTTFRYRSYDENRSDLSMELSGNDGPDTTTSHKGLALIVSMNLLKIVVRCPEGTVRDADGKCVPTFEEYE